MSDKDIERAQEVDTKFIRSGSITDQARFVINDYHQGSVIFSKHTALQFCQAYLDLKELKQILRDYEAGKRVEWKQFL